MDVSSVNKHNADYGVEQIKTLEGIEAIRLRAGMYIGSVGQAGVQHITLEIISNSVDEYLNGHCTLCQICVDEKGVITVQDNGRGVPFGKAEDGSETLVNVYTKLHTGAKFDSDGKTGYNTSGGMNGVGAKATNALSEYFHVESCRGGKIATAKFKKGELESYKEAKFSENSHGTKVVFLPDKTIFKEGIPLDKDALKNGVITCLCEKQADTLEQLLKQADRIQSTIINWWILEYKQFLSPAYLMENPRFYDLLVQALSKCNFFAPQAEKWVDRLQDLEDAPSAAKVELAFVISLLKHAIERSGVTGATRIRRADIPKELPRTERSEEDMLRGRLQELTQKKDVLVREIEKLTAERFDMERQIAKLEAELSIKRSN